MKKNKRSFGFDRARLEVFKPLWIALIAALIGLFLVVLSEHTQPPGLLLLYACACMMVGTVFGFLFGIPRSISSPAPDTKGYRANTNLEDVSDWLTKILIGIGLVQAKSIAALVQSVVERVAAECGNVLPKEPMVLLWSMLAFFIVLGFFGGYLRTRIFLPKLFSVADGQSDFTLKDRKAEIKKDRAAMYLVERQLARGDFSKEHTVDPQRLTKKIIKSSDDLKPRIYYKARELRVLHEKGHESAETMRCSIPVFEALLENDKHQHNGQVKYYQTHAQLGLVNMRLEEPASLVRAVEQFDEAIRIRSDSKRPSGKHYYELARALARVLQDIPPTEDPKTDLIYQDLAYAAANKVRLFDGSHAAEASSGGNSAYVIITRFDDYSRLLTWVDKYKDYLKAYPKIEIYSAGGQRPPVVIGS